MKRFKTVDEYILNAKNGKEMLIVLREIILSTALTEAVKWGSPVYTFKGKNLIGIASFKSYVGLWFFQGALLKDNANVLINAQEDVTKALRQLRFKSADEINEKLIIKYINESIENLKQNKEIKPNRNKPILFPEELKEAFKNNSALETQFLTFTHGRKREFADYISQAKRAETRQSRLQKIIPLVLDGIGLNDKYRK